MQPYALNSLPPAHWVLHQGTEHAWISCEAPRFERFPSKQNREDISIHTFNRIWVATNYPTNALCKTKAEVEDMFMGLSSFMGLTTILPPKHGIT